MCRVFLQGRLGRQDAWAGPSPSRRVKHKKVSNRHGKEERFASLPYQLEHFDTVLHAFTTNPVPRYIWPKARYFFSITLALSVYDSRSLGLSLISTEQLHKGLGYFKHFLPALVYDSA